MVLYMAKTLHCKWSVIFLTYTLLPSLQLPMIHKYTASCKPRYNWLWLWALQQQWAMVCGCKTSCWQTAIVNCSNQDSHSCLKSLKLLCHRKDDNNYLCLFPVPSPNMNNLQGRIIIWNSLKKIWNSSKLFCIYFLLLRTFIFPREDHQSPFQRATTDH